MRRAIVFGAVLATVAACIVAFVVAHRSHTVAAIATSVPPGASRAIRFPPIAIPRSLPDLATTSTIAGSGKSGVADGIARSAQFVEPMGLAADRAGIIYVCDRFGQRIRRVARNGTVTTIAGGGAEYAPSLAVPPGYHDGPGPTARFNRPTGIAVANDGTIFVADEGNHVIRAIRRGVVSTYAGNAASAGHTDGPLAFATFTAPTALTLDAYGNLYVADYPVLRKIAPTGRVNTILTPEPVVSLASTIDDGNREVVIAMRDVIILIDARNEALIRQRGLRDLESGEAAGEIDGVAAYDEDTLVYADPLTHVVRFRTLLTNDDYARPIAGTPLQRGYSRGGGFRDGTGDVAAFSNPTGVAILPDGSLAISDTGNRRIRRLAPFNVESAGKEEAAHAEFPTTPPGPSEFRIILLGDSYVWTNVAWHESIGGILADALAKRTRRCSKHVAVYVVRHTGLLPAPGFEYIDEILATGIASMVVYDLPQGGQTGAQTKAMILASERALADVDAKLLMVTFPESWDIASESEFYRESHENFDVLSRAYDWPKRQETIDAIAASKVDSLNIWPLFADVATSADHPPLFESGDIHLTPYGNALVAAQILRHLELESPAPWGACAR